MLGRFGNEGGRGFVGATADVVDDVVGAVAEVVVVLLYV